MNTKSCEFGASGLIHWLAGNCRKLPETCPRCDSLFGCERPDVEKTMLFFTALYARADDEAAGATLNGGKPQLTCKRTKF